MPEFEETPRPIISLSCSCWLDHDGCFIDKALTREMCEHLLLEKEGLIQTSKTHVQDSVRYTETGVTNSYDLPCGWWELNLGSLQEQQMILTAEPSALKNRILVFGQYNAESEAVLPKGLGKKVPLWYRPGIPIALEAEIER